MNAYNILSQNAFWRINKALTVHLDDITASAIVSFLVDKEQYHRANNSMVEDEGELWFYATSEAIHEETRLSYRKQKAAFKKIEDAGFIRTKLMGLPAKVHFSIDHDKIIEVIIGENKFSKSGKTSFSENAKLDLAKTQNNNKNKETRTKEEEREREDAPQLSEADKFIKDHTPPRNGFDPFSKTEGPEWQGGNEEDYQHIYKKIAEHLNVNKKTWAEVASLAYCKMTPKQFKDELEAWIRYYLPQQKLFHNPVQNLRGGRISFVGWLKKPWAQEKYNPEKKPTTQSTAGTRRTVTAKRSK